MKSTENFTDKGVLGNSLVKDLGVENKVKCQPAIADGVEYNLYPHVDFNDLPISWLSSGIIDALEAISFKEIQTCVSDASLEGTGLSNTVEELLTASFKCVLGMRLADVNNKKCVGGRANVEYPSLLGPIVAAYGRVEKRDIGVEIWPCATPELIEDMKNYGCFTVKEMKEGETLEVDNTMQYVISYQMPEWYKEFMRFFRIYKLMTNYGMPKDKVVQDDSIYRVTTLSNLGGVLIGREPQISPDVQLIATIVKAASLANIYGQYRVEYGAISSMRSAIEDIALKAIHLNAQDRE